MWDCFHLKVKSQKGGRLAGWLGMFFLLPEDEIRSPPGAARVQPCKMFSEHTKNEFKQAFSNLAGWFEERFRKASFSWRISVWTVGLTAEIKLRFHIPPGEWVWGVSLLVGVAVVVNLLVLPAIVGIRLLWYLFSQGLIQLCSRQHRLRSCSRCG